MKTVGVITKGGTDLTCPNCAGTHTIHELLYWANDNKVLRREVRPRPCCRCRLKVVA